MDSNNPLDALLNVPGEVGDVERDYASNPPLPGETPFQTEERQVSTQRVQQQAQQTVNRMKGRDLAAQGNAIYTDDKGNVQPVTDATGTPVSHYNKAANVGYDSQGNPVQVTPNEYGGAPAVEDAFKDVPTTIDQDTGAKYRIRKGLGWKYLGQDEQATAAALEQEKQKAVKDASEALGRQLTVDERQLHRDQTQYKAMQKGLFGMVPSLQNQPDDTSLDDAHKAIDSHFNDLYAAPEANEKSGWFGSGDFSPQATILRNGYDQQKAKAHQLLDQMSSLKDLIAERSQHIDQQTAQQSNLLHQRADVAVGRAQDFGALPPPGQDQDTLGAHNPSAAGSSPALAPEQIDQLNKALTDARAGNKPYTYDDASGVHFQPQNMADGLRQAVNDHLVSPEWAQQHLPDFQAAQDKYQALQQAAGGAQELKALLHGGGIGAAFWAGSIPGAKLGAAAGAAIPGAGETGIPELIGGALGGLTTGTIAAFAARKALDKLADYSDTIKSLNSSAQLHPMFDAAGELVGMSANAPEAVSNVYKAAQIAKQVGGTVAAAKLVGKIAAGGAAGGAVFEGAIRPLFDYASNALADQLGIQHDQVQSPTLKSMATNIALGIITAGHNIKFKDYSSQDIASMFTRAQMRNMVGVPLDAELTPQQVAEAFNKMGLDSNQAANTNSAPLSKTEQAVFNAIGEQAKQMKATGQFDSSTIKGITAKQAFIPEFGKREGTPLTTAKIETNPGESGGGGQPEPTTPAVGGPAAETTGTQQQPPSPEVEGKEAIQKAVMAGTMSHAEATDKLTKLGLNNDDIVRAIGKSPSVENQEEVPPTNVTTEPQGAAPRGQQPTKGPGNAVQEQSANESSVLGSTGAGNEGQGGEVGQGNAGSQQPSGARQQQSTGATGASATAPKETVDQAAHEAATSTKNELEHPTEGQKKAGNYAKGHLRLGGMDISIENPAGSSRRPEWPPLTAHYGYIRGTEGNDGDHIDTFIKPGTPLDYKGPVFVVNQNKPDGTYDEAKAVIGVGSKKEAHELYASNYSKVPGIHSIAEFPSLEMFKQWAMSTRVQRSRGERLPAENPSGGSVSNANGLHVTPEESSALKSALDAGVGHFVSGSNRSDGKSLLAKLNGLIQRPSKSSEPVNLNMLPLGNDLKISDGVVKSIPVAMVNDLLGGELSSKSFLHNNSVFKPLSPDTVNDDAYKAIGSIMARKSADVSTSGRASHEPNSAINSSNVNPESIAKEIGATYQGKGDQGLHAFKDEKTGGNFSLSDAELTPEKAKAKLQETRDKFQKEKQISTEKERNAAIEKAKAEAEEKPTEGQKNYAVALANAALKLHKSELDALGHPDEFIFRETPAKSGIITDSNSGRIVIDKEKFAAAVSKLGKEEASKWVKRAVAHEIIHLGTVKYAKESTANMQRLLSLNGDKELMEKTGEIYGPEWEGLNEFQRAAEAARVLLEGPENLTESSYKFLDNLLKWLREKLGTLSKDVRELLNGIEEKLGRYKKRELEPSRPEMDDEILAHQNAELKRINKREKKIASKKQGDKFDQAADELKKGFGDLFAANPDEEKPVFISKLTKTIQSLPQSTMTVGQARAAILKGAKPDEIKQQGLLDDPLSPLVGKPDDSRVTKSELTDYSLERQAKVQDVMMGGEQRVLDANGRPMDDGAGGIVTRGTPASFSQYQLPGAEPGSYREQFVTWPSSGLTHAEAQSKLKALVESATKRGRWMDEELKEADRLSKIQVRGNERDSSENWHDGHSQYNDIANPIVRIRRNIREDSQGRRTYFIEEIQGPSAAEQQKMPEPLRKRIYEIGMKRAIRDAIDQGADAIGWTTGEQQTERYDLSNTISKIVASKSSIQNQFHVQAFKKGNDSEPIIHVTDQTPSELEAIVGKELAQKIVAQEGKTQTYSNTDLKVGGEGLKSLYDVMLPRIANKLAEKVGGKVERGQIDKLNPEKMEMGDHLDRAENPDFGKAPIHTMPIPEAWKEQTPQFNLYAANPEAGYTSKLPPERMADAITMAQKLEGLGIKSPEDLATTLGRISEKAKGYSQSFWFFMKGIGADGPSEPDWKSIYEPGELSQPSKKPEKIKPAMGLASVVADALKDGPLNRNDLGKLAAKHPGLTVKQIDEAAEHGVVIRGRMIVEEGRAQNHDAGKVFDRLLELYNRQPNLTAKTSASKINQAYSTPIPLGFLASHLAGVNEKTYVLEPTAGNGALLLEADPAHVLANEIDPTRRAALKAQGFDVSDQDATKPFSGEFTRIVENPPFGVLKGENGQATMFPMAGGGETREIDHAIVLNTLQNLAPNGRASLIIGGSQAIDPNARRQHYASGERGEFFKRLYEQYKVVDHFTVNGDLYKKQGAGWPVDIITIAGKGKSPIQLPNQEPPRILNTWSELRSELNRTDDDRIQAGQYDEGKHRNELGESLAGVRTALAGRRGAGEKRPASQFPAESNSGGGNDESGAASREPAATSSSEGVEQPAERPEGGLGNGAAEHGGSGQRGLVTLEAQSDEEKPQFHKPYVPVSKGTSFGIETPAGIADAQRHALEEIQRKVGKPLAEYAREKMGYKKGYDLSKHFAAEQLDAIASAIHNIETAGALVLGDMAGVGKGRVVAGLIEYAKRNGFLPIFVTKDEALFSAMLGDFHNIGRTVNPLFTNNNLNILHPITDAEIKTRDMNPTMELIAKDGQMPHGHDAVFTSYHQLGKDFAKGETAEERRAAMRAGRLPLPGKRTAALNALVARNRVLFLLDESHLAAGESIQGGRLLKMLENPNARAYYSSATFAKRPDSMPLYFKTNLSKAAGSAKNLMEVFKRGGVVMQQVASQMLAQDGQYIRRERSYDGVPFETRINTDTEERDRKLANEYTRGLRTILDMSNRVKDAVKSMNAIMVRAGKKMDISTIKMEAADFASQIHNFVSQYLFAIKAEAAAQQAIQAIKVGHQTKDGTVKSHKVIVAVQNTMEQPIKGLHQEGLTLEFGSLLVRTLNGLRRVKTRGSESAGTAEYTHIGRKPDPRFKNDSDDNLVAQLIKVETISTDEGPKQIGVVVPEVAAEVFRRIANDAFLDAEAELKQLNLGGMPLSPIDHIRQRVQDEGIKTAEITGRTTGIDKYGAVYEREPEDSTKRGQLAALKDFNNGDTHLLVINQSGSTGISAHSDKTFKNHSPRMMVIAQPHLDINEFTQTLGRIFRSGQVELPRYQLLQTALPAEKRPAAILGKKMASLNANTTSNTDSEVSHGTNVVDVFNEYGDAVVYKYLADNPKFLKDLQYPKIVDKDGKLAPIKDILDDMEEDGKLARNVASYAGLLPVEEQEMFWDDVLNRYTAQIKYLDQIGENKLRAAAADLGAETVSSKVFTPGDPNGKSSFDAPSHMEMVKVKPKQTPLEPAEVMKQAHDIAIRRPKIIADYKKQSSEWVEKYLEKRKEKSISDWATQEQRERERLRNQYAEVWAQLGRLGNPVIINTSNGKKVGAITNVEIDPDAPVTPSKVIFTVANNTLRREMKIPASQMAERLVDMDPDQFDVQYNASREDKAQRVIITGNLIAAYAKLQWRGAVTLYTKSDGSVATGILMPGDYDPNAVERENIRDVGHALDVLRNGQEISSSDGKVRIALKGGKYLLEVPSSKQAGGKFWQDPAVNRAMKNGFEQKGQWMVGEISNLGEVVGIMDRLGATLGYRPNSGTELAAADPSKIKVGDRVNVYKKPGTITSIKGKKMTVSLDEGGVIPAHVDNVTPIPAETPEAKAAAAAKASTNKPAGVSASSIAEDIGRQKEEAKKKLSDVIAGAKAVYGSAKSFFTQLAPVTDYLKAKGEWLGTGALDDPRSTGRQKSDYEVRQMERAINSKFSPAEQEAITNFIQAGGDKSTLQQRAGASSPSLAPGYEAAAKLSGEPLKFVDEVKSFYAAKAKQAQEAGILDDLLTDYVNQMWDRRNDPSYAAQNARNRNLGDVVGPGRLNTRFENAFERIHESYFAGEQKGLKPFTKKIGKLMALWAESFNRVMQNRAFIKLLLHEINATDGRPAATISGYAKPVSDSGGDALLVTPRGKSDETADYVRIENPALRGWKWVHVDPVTGTNTFVKGDILIHPEIAGDLKRTLGKSAIQNTPIIRQLRNLQFAVKQTLLSMSAFHFVQEGTHALGHTINPFHPVQIDINDQTQRELINSGLMIASHEARRDFMEGVAGGGLIDKLPVIGKMNQELNAFLFEDYIPRLKMTMAIEALKRNLARFEDDIKAGKITRQQILFKTAQQSNDAFGEQNYRMMGRSQTFQDILRLGLLAPDFLESRLKFAADATTKYGSEQRRALLILAATMFLTAKLAEKALTGDYDWRHPFSVTYKGREYKLRSVPGDMIDLFADTRRFIYGRISPIISRGIIEGLTGRDWRGQKRSFGEQLGDMLKAPVPIAIRGIIDKRTDINPGEELAGATGLSIKRHSDITETRVAGRDYQVAHGKANPDEVFPPSKYQKLKYALEDGNESKARQAFDELAKQEGRDQVMQGFRKSLLRPFSGGRETEQDFVKGLSQHQRTVYNRATAKQAVMMAMLQRISAAASVTEAPSKPKHIFTGFHS